MSVNGKRENIGKSDIIELAKKMNIKKPNEIIEKVISSVSQWMEFASDAGVPTRQIKSINRTFTLI